MDSEPPWRVISSVNGDGPFTEGEEEGVPLSFKMTPLTEKDGGWSTPEDDEGLSPPKEMTPLAEEDDGWSTEKEANGEGWFTESEDDGLSPPKEMTPSEGEGLWEFGVE